MKKDISKLYDVFTPDERVKLALAAKIRGDNNELKRLWDTCPRKTYRMPDAAFDEKMEGILLLAKSVLTQMLLIEKDLAIISISNKWYTDYIVATVASYAKGANNAWKKAGKKGVLFDIEGREPTDEELKEIGLVAAFEKTPEMLINQREGTIAELKGYMAALERFCLEIGIKAEDIISAYQETQEAYDRIKHYMEVDIPPDERYLNTMYAAFREHLPMFQARETA